MSSALPSLARAAAARLLRTPRARITSSRAPSRAMAAPAYDAKQSPAPEGMSRVLFVQVGMGIDQHGQDATKAAVRAVRNAIERNSIPCIKSVVPGGSYDAVKVHVKLGVPFPDQRIDAAAIEKAREAPGPRTMVQHTAKRNADSPYVAPPGAGVSVRHDAAAAGGARRPGVLQRHHGAADGRRGGRNVHHRRCRHRRPLEGTARAGGAFRTLVCRRGMTGRDASDERKRQVKALAVSRSYAASLAASLAAAMSSGGASASSASASAASYSSDSALQRTQFQKNS